MLRKIYIKLLYINFNMERIIYIISVFLFVAFIYIHVLFHLKVNNLLELNTIEITGKEDFEEQCNRRLPFICNYNTKQWNDTFNIEKIKNDFKSFTFNVNNDNIKLHDLINNDRFISMNNKYFLDETELFEQFIKTDNFLRPSCTFIKNYDLVIGKNFQTNFISFLNFRNFLYVSEGSIELYLAPPKSSKYLNYFYNFYTFSNETKINPFDKNTQQTDMFDKIKPLKIQLKKGEMLFIPSSWYVSISFNEISVVQLFHYRTCMNLVTLTPNYIRCFYEQINIKNN